MEGVIGLHLLNLHSMFGGGWPGSHGHQCFVPRSVGFREVVSETMPCTDSSCCMCCLSCKTESGRGILDIQLSDFKPA